MKTQIVSIYSDLNLLPPDFKAMVRLKQLSGPGMGATQRSLHYMMLEPGSKTHPISHETSEAVFYIAQGKGTILDLDKNETFQLREGSVMFVTPATPYVIKATGPEALICIGGPCPPDPKIYEQAGLRW